MANDSKSPSPSDTRLEVFIAFSIALVSITTALVAWRSNVVGSAQGDATRQGLIDAIKLEAAASEDWRMVYQEAGFAQSYDAYAAGLQALAASNSPTAKAEAEQLTQFMLPAMAQLSTLSNNDTYRTADGAYDLEKRYQDLRAEAPDLAALSPDASFKQADSYTNEQRWLTLNIVLLVVTLFWLTLAQIGAHRLRLATLAIGGALYFFSLAWFGVVELVFFILRTRG